MDRSCASLHGNMSECRKCRSIEPKRRGFLLHLDTSSTFENPTGDTPDDLQDNIILGFVGIFSHAREKFLANLWSASIHIYQRIGPNLGGKSMEIHQAVNHFVFRYWFAAHDQSLNDCLICYGKLQESAWAFFIDVFYCSRCEIIAEVSFSLNEVGNGWHVIWNRLMRSLPTFCNVTSIVSIFFHQQLKTE
ncbi:serine/threonine-protein kinase ATM-like [Primulina huaijiensis]|uniref:serine/threonine-protein kinase ATM-like n=1 Tax=Primulina huaijiensis TaxID=1492673 RepID=UPI003CC77E4B